MDSRDMDETDGTGSSNDPGEWINVNHDVSRQAAEEVSGVDCKVDKPEGELSSLESRDEAFPSATSVEQKSAETITIDNNGSAPAQVPFSDTSEEPPQFTDMKSTSVIEESLAPSNQVHVAGSDGPQTSELPPEWTHAQCLMTDIRYAANSTVSVPHRVTRQKLKILFTGQPETGRTTTIKNLFASLVQDSAWEPKDVDGLNIDDFANDPSAFTTTITEKSDTNGNHNISYILQETPGLKGDIDWLTRVLCSHLQKQQDEYATQEKDLSISREQITDGRIDAVLYFLPTNARIGDSEMDYKVINALARYAPVIPVMCKADCLEEKEISKRKCELERLKSVGLKVFSFPDDIVESITENIAGLNSAEETPESSQRTPNQQFKLPFNVVTGSQINYTIHGYWFVRKYKWAECEAYCTENSDLRLLRQLLLEEGFWALKSEAEKLYRARMVEAPEAIPKLVTEEEESEFKKSAETVSVSAEVQVCRAEGMKEPRNEGTMVAQNDEEQTQGLKVPFGADPLQNTGALNVGSSLDPKRGSQYGVAGFWAKQPPACPKSPPGFTNFLSINSEDTESSIPIVAGASALEALAEEPPTQDSATKQEVSHDEDPFDESTCVRTEVKYAQKGSSRNYRLTLSLFDSKKIMCLRIGESEGTSIAASLNSDRGAGRPSPYDATMALLKQLGCRLVRIVVTECKNTIFYARVHAINTASGRRVDVDARPSDAINLALREGAPMYIHKTVVDQFAIDT